MIDEKNPVITFTAEDRCDGCRAQAYTMAKHEDFGELLFCRHHREEAYDALIDEGWTVIDDLEALNTLYNPYPSTV